MTGLLLHLSAPLQSWGTDSQWNTRHTHTHPTRSGLIGLLAAAEGLQRGEPLDRYDVLEFTIRIDRPGAPLVDFHTVGGGRPREQTPPRAMGGHRAAGKGTIVSHRHYLTDAAFTVAITSTDPQTLDDLKTALQHPIYTLYLGRRSCPPSSPLLIGTHPDPVTALHTSIPLARPKPLTGDSTPVTFVTERPSATAARADVSPTRPQTFGETRRYRSHTSWTATHDLPVTLCAGYSSHYLAALAHLDDARTPQ